VEKKEIRQKQREVSKMLGRNITKDHDKIYEEIRGRIGDTKKCRFGHTRGSKTGVKHEGNEDVPISDFELKGITIDKDGTVIIRSGDGLQGFVAIVQRGEGRLG